MKMHEIKDVTVNLAFNQKAKVMTKKVALLAPKMFKKFKSGFKKGLTVIRNSKVAEVVTNIPGNVKDIASTVKETVTNTVDNAKVSLNNKYDFEGAHDYSQMVGNDYSNNKVSTIESKIAEAKLQKDHAEAKLSQADSNDKYDDALKSYIINCYESQIQKLDKKAKVATGRSFKRALIVKKAFLGKMFNTRKKRFISDLTNYKLKRNEAKIEKENAKAAFMAEQQENAVIEEYLERIHEIEEQTRQLQEFAKKYNITQAKVESYTARNTQEDVQKETVENSYAR